MAAHQAPRYPPDTKQEEVLFAGHFTHPFLPGQPIKEGGEVDEVSFREPVVVTAIQVGGMGPVNPAMLPGFVSQTQQHPFQIEVFCKDLSNLNKAYFDFLLPQVPIHGGGSWRVTGDYVTNLIMVRGAYEAMSLVVYGHVIDRALLPAQITVALPPSLLPILAPSPGPGPEAAGPVGPGPVGPGSSAAADVRAGDTQEEAGGGAGVAAAAAGEETARENEEAVPESESKPEPAAKRARTAWSPPEQPTLPPSLQRLLDQSQLGHPGVNVEDVKSGRQGLVRQLKRRDPYCQDFCLPAAEANAAIVAIGAVRSDEEASLLAAAGAITTCLRATTGDMPCAGVLGGPKARQVVQAALKALPSIPVAALTLLEVALVTPWAAETLLDVEPNGLEALLEVISSDAAGYVKALAFGALGNAVMHAAVRDKFTQDGGYEAVALLLSTSSSSSPVGSAGEDGSVPGLDEDVIERGVEVMRVPVLAQCLKAVKDLSMEAGIAAVNEPLLGEEESGLQLMRGAIIAEGKGLTVTAQPLQDLADGLAAVTTLLRGPLIGKCHALHKQEPAEPSPLSCEEEQADDVGSLQKGMPLCLVRMLWDNSLPAVLATAAATAARASMAEARVGARKSGVGAAAAALYSALRSLCLVLLEGRGDALQGAFLMSADPQAAVAIASALDPTGRDMGVGIGCGGSMTLSALRDGLPVQAVTPAGLASLIRAAGRASDVAGLITSAGRTMVEEQQAMSQMMQAASASAAGREYAALSSEQLLFPSKAATAAEASLFMALLEMDCQGGDDLLLSRWPEVVSLASSLSCAAQGIAANGSAELGAGVLEMSEAVEMIKAKGPSEGPGVLGLASVVKDGTERLAEQLIKCSGEQQRIQQATPSVLSVTLSLRMLCGLCLGRQRQLYTAHGQGLLEGLIKLLKGVALSLALRCNAGLARRLATEAGGLDPDGAAVAAVSPITSGGEVEDIKRFERRLLSCCLPALRLLEALLSQLSDAGVSCFAGDAQVLPCVFDLQAAVASLPLYQANVAGEILGATTTGNLALRAEALATKVCDLWCPPAAWSQPADPDDLLKGSPGAHLPVLSLLVSHMLAAPAHLIGGLRLLRRVLTPELPVSLHGLPPMFQQLGGSVHLASVLGGREGLKQSRAASLEISMRKHLKLWDTAAAEPMAQAVTTLCQTSSPVAKALVHKVARQAMDIGPATSKAVASALMKRLGTHVANYNQRSKAGKKVDNDGDSAWEPMCHVLEAVLDLASKHGSAGRVALLSAGAMEALVPCLALPRPEALRATMEVLSCFCDGPVRAAEVRKYSDPPCPFATLALAVRNVVGKWHRVDLHVHATGVRLLATLGSAPACASDVLSALRPKGAESAGVVAAEGKTTMLLPRLYSGLAKGLEDTCSKYKQRAAWGRSSEAADWRKGEELDRRVLRQCRAVCWGVQLPLALVAEGLVDAADVLKVLVPPGVPRGSEPLGLLQATVEKFSALHEASAAQLEEAADAQGSIPGQMCLLAAKCYLSVLSGAFTKLSEICDVVRGMKASSALTSQPPNKRVSSLEGWYVTRPVVSQSGPGVMEELGEWLQLWMEGSECLGQSLIGRVMQGQEEEDTAALLEWKTQCCELKELVARHEEKNGKKDGREQTQEEGEKEQPGVQEVAGTALLGKRKKVVALVGDLRATKSVPGSLKQPVKQPPVAVAVAAGSPAPAAAATAAVTGHPGPAPSPAVAVAVPSKAEPSDPRRRRSLANDPRRR